MTEVMMKVNEYEAETRRLTETYLAANAEDFTVRMACRVFEVMWSESLPVNRVRQVAEALYRVTPDADFQPVLTKMVRAGVLRSRRLQGKRLYEVNY